MKKKGLELDITAYGALVDGFCKMQDMERALDLYSELLEVGLSPCTVLYNCLISGFRDLNNMEVHLVFRRKW